MEVEVGTAVVIVAMGAVAAKALGSRAMAAEGIPVVMVNPPVDSAAFGAICAARGARARATIITEAIASPLRHSLNAFVVAGDTYLLWPAVIAVGPKLAYLEGGARSAIVAGLVGGEDAVVGAEEGALSPLERGGHSTHQQHRLRHRARTPPERSTPPPRPSPHSTLSQALLLPPTREPPSPPPTPTPTLSLPSPHRRSALARLSLHIEDRARRFLTLSLLLRPAGGHSSSSSLSLSPPSHRISGSSSPS
eukprot:scaffold12751_cov24-Tisochrysis_lutea.AAC.1